MAIDVELNNLVFSIPTTSDHNWQDLTDWFLEVNATLNAAATSFNIPAGSANLTDAMAVSLFTINAPADNAHIIFEYGITRITTSTGAQSLSETGTLYLAFNSITGNWESTNTSVGNAKVALSVSGGNIIQATATALTGTPSVSTIDYSGRIIRT